MMVITTETGSSYQIEDSGICKKRDSAGRFVSVFKVIRMTRVPDSAESMEDILSMFPEEPAVGSRVYISGLNEWWLSTRVVAIEGRLDF
jgi:hypothetical protein